MNRKTAAVLMALVTSTFALAGCAGDDGGDEITTEAVDKDTFELEAGKGAIAGLLVDDRFRPIDLEDEPENEFQAKGFVLLQETGQKVQTTENGEFSFVGLDPGRYTIRVNVEEHEAAPQTVNVDSGVFSDASVVARRIANVGGTILTQEFAVFIDCWIPFWTELNCFLDMSLDSKRAGFTADYLAVSDLTYVVSEFLFDKSGGYDGDVGVCNGESFSGWHSTEIIGDYGKLTLTNDQSEYENQTEDGYLGGYLREQKFCTVVWPHGQLPEYGVPFNFGFGISTKAQILQSVFIGAPDVDLEAYCVLCQ